jgi:hypothetical protein
MHRNMVVHVVTPVKIHVAASSYFEMLGTIRSCPAGYVMRRAFGAMKYDQ